MKGRPAGSRYPRPAVRRCIPQKPRSSLLVTTTTAGPQTAMEEHVPRTPWRRRRTTDSPRPAGRRWAGRLRRSGTIARQALTVRVGRRRADSGSGATAVRSEVLYTGSDLLAQPRPVTEGRRVGPAVEPAR